MTIFHADDYVEFLQNVNPNNEHNFPREVERFNVDMDCPVFDGLWKFCQLSSGASVGKKKTLLCFPVEITTTTCWCLTCLRRFQFELFLLLFSFLQIEEVNLLLSFIMFFSTLSLNRTRFQTQQTSKTFYKGLSIATKKLKKVWSVHFVFPLKSKERCSRLCWFQFLVCLRWWKDVSSAGGFAFSHFV